MSNLGTTYVASELPEQRINDPVPAGMYIATITEASVESTKDRTGAFIKLRLDIAGPSYVGRVLFDRINIKNKSEKAEEIGLSQLRGLMAALGLARVSDTNELVNGVVQVKVTIENNGEYGPSNVVKAYKPTEGSIPPTVSTKSLGKPAAQSPTVAVSASKIPPWKSSR